MNRKVLKCSVYWIKLFEDAEKDKLEEINNKKLNN